jgi:hypothetical protein
MSLKLNSSGGGSVTLQEPSTANNQTLTLPDNTGTLVSTASTFAGTGPAFSAYRNGTQSISSGTFTKIQFNVEEFDTNNCYDSTTNYRFTPNVAGYYQINGSLNNVPSSSPTQASIAIFKNGSAFKYGTYITAGTGMSVNVSNVVYFNGSTDYVEIYAFITAASAGIEGSSVANTYFNAAMVRAA